MKKEGLIKLKFDSIINRRIIPFITILLLTCCISIPFNLEDFEFPAIDYVVLIFKTVMVNPKHYGICGEIVPILFSKFVFNCLVFYFDRYLSRSDIKIEERNKWFHWCLDLLNEAENPQIYLNSLVLFI